jgi:hypothetical protein
VQILTLYAIFPIKSIDYACCKCFSRFLLRIFRKPAIIAKDLID